jgi:hypothetical protein
MKVLILFLMAGVQTAASETVFEKALSESNKLVVLRRELPAATPNSAEQRALQAKAPGAVYVHPDKTYELKVLLVEQQRRTFPKLLWEEIVPHYDMGPAIPSDVKFLDASRDGTNLFLVYKYGTLTYTRTACGLDGTNPPVVSKAQRLLTDSPSTGRIVAKVEWMSTAASSPRVLVTFANQEKELYAFMENKWQKVPEANPSD